MGEGNGVTVRPLAAEEAHERAAALAELLVDCVEGGASVSFLAPLDRGKAVAFWRGVAEGVARGKRALVVAEDGPEIVGTAQLVLAQPENQPHRADLAKMLVRRSARRRGVGAALLRAAEEAAWAAGKTLLVLDTSSAEAERLYARRLDPGRRRPGLRPPARRAALRYHLFLQAPRVEAAVTG